ncbi:flagellar basal body P-ring protein FlgI [Sansalvadorimonas sp. 2012CJ34-2]|uniref:Flagellar P-ring protein n=1 Tax=Parendozoicomonas callyspongiae TaxID=2942213 RepID=A0ABT0PFE6_9GAMM|nr:flagellar basal body P-ring protein FlgI [Sansalvadorimonas sp. 2012CJ34-2]MCL6270099.1 flagellar basal body P-ring protein FlgI [Sansalvadorimonas sp. 2012CJ34-2]
MKRILPLLFLLLCTQVKAERLLDLVDISGVRSNQLVGYGLVVGLDGSGDKTRQTKFTSQSLNNMLRQLGIQLPAGTDPNIKNVAAVSITATLPAFARPGQKIDITVSSIGDAKSLNGGTLLLAPLKGIDGNVYALAQGNLVVSGISVEGNSGSEVTVNIPTVGRIPSGATVEREVPSNFASQDFITLNLRSPSFTTARNIVRSINELLGPSAAKARDSASITVSAPADSGQKVTFMAMLENLDVESSRPPARVVINSRTGTVVMNQDVRVTTAAVSHGNLIVSIQESSNVSQPNSFTSGGQAVTTPQSDIQVEQGNSRLFMMPESHSLQEVVNAVNSVGATPADLMAVLQALKEAGSLKAELVVI